MNDIYVAISLNSNKDGNPKECARKDYQQARKVLAQAIKQESSDLNAPIPVKDKDKIRQAKTAYCSSVLRFSSLSHSEELAPVDPSNSNSNSEGKNEQ